MSRTIVVLLIAHITALHSLAQSISVATKPDEVIKAESLFREGKTAEAFAKLQEALKKHPELPPARLLLARLQFAANQPGPARQSLEQVAVEVPYHPDVFLTNASQALSEGRLTDTILSCQAALSLADTDRWPIDQKKTFRREAHAGLAAAFETRKDWESARTHLLALLEFEPKSSAFRQRLARAQFMLGRETEALNELRQATRDDEKTELAEVAMARLWSFKGDTQKAEDWFEQAVQKAPKDARVHRAFGGWLLDHGRLDGARIHIEAALTLDPKSRDGLALKGLFARYQKDHATAAKIFDELLREEPGNFYASNHLALALAEMPDQQHRAIQLAEVNARQYPRMADALATLGWIYFKAGRLEDAEKALTASASSGQISSDTAYYLARLLKAKGRVTDAKEILKKAVESEGAFVNRGNANSLLTEMEKTSSLRP